MADRVVNYGLPQHDGRGKLWRNTIDSMCPKPELWPLLACYFSAPQTIARIQPLGSGGGWSGSQLWQVTDRAGREFCLRRWPREHPTPQRLQFIHAVICRVASELSAVAYPLPTNAGETSVAHAGHLWQLDTWRSGQADFHHRPTRARLRAAMHALARFHDLAATYESRRGPAPAVIDRQRQITELRGEGAAEIERSLHQPLGAEMDLCCRHVFELARSAIRGPLIERMLCAGSELPISPAIRDIHHDHVLFTQDEVTGVIDFGALRIDTPLADVARLVGSLVDDDRDARHFAMEAYAELRPLNDNHRQLIDLLDESGLVLAAFNWLKWLYVERRDMGDAASIIRRLNELTERLQKRA